MAPYKEQDDQAAFEEFKIALERRMGRKLYRWATVRSCGGCTACCKTHQVTEVGTDAGELCQFAAIGEGCSIYAKRPFECRLYACWWLRGKGEESDRPDRLKVVMDDREVTLNGWVIGVVDLHEVEPGAINQPRVRQLTDAFLQQGAVVCHWFLAPDEAILPGGERYTRAYLLPEGLFTQAEKDLLLATAEK
ncbi:MAG: hypothetical protein AAB533_00435 [Patescibacteria group bacterium]